MRNEKRNRASRLGLLSSIGVVCIAGWAAAQEQAAAPALTQPALTQLVARTGPDAVVFDGHVSEFEYLDARQSIHFVAGHGEVITYVRQCGEHLYFAFRIPELTPHIGDDIVVMLDLDNSRAKTPQANCIRAYVRRKMENSRMHKGKSDKWDNLYGEWEYKSALYDRGWEAEVRIPLKAVGVTDGASKTLGLAFRIWDNEPLKKWNWPETADEEVPETWGTLVINGGD